MGADPAKLILGMPLYGHGFTLNDANKHDLYDLAYQPIPAGPYTQQSGTWGYNEVSLRYSQQLKDPITSSRSDVHMFSRYVLKPD